MANPLSLCESPKNSGACESSAGRAVGACYLEPGTAGFCGAAAAGQGVALGRAPLMRDLARSSNLATPFARMIASPRCYHLIRSQRPLGNPAVNAFEK